MARVNDPYVEDPYFRDALIINHSGGYTNRPKLDRSVECAPCRGQA